MTEPAVAHKSALGGTVRARDTLAHLTLICWLLLAVTGVFLMYFYRPTASAAYTDMESLRSSVTFGLIARRIHELLAWPAAILPVALAVRHFRNGFMKPAIVGFAAFWGVALAWFSGYLLPWDQLALWAVTQGTNMMGFEPIFGENVRFVLIGGVEISTSQLIFWFQIHTIAAPAILMIITFIYVALMRSRPGQLPAASPDR